PVIPVLVIPVLVVRLLVVLLLVMVLPGVPVVVASVVETPLRVASLARTLRTRWRRCRQHRERDGHHACGLEHGTDELRSHMGFLRLAQFYTRQFLSFPFFNIPTCTGSYMSG